MDEDKMSKINQYYLVNMGTKLLLTPCFSGVLVTNETQRTVLTVFHAVERQ